MLIHADLTYINCIDCTKQIIKTGRNHKRCQSCADLARRQNWKDWARKNIIRIGHWTPSGPDNPGYIHGRCTFRRWAKERKETQGCERCGKDLRTAPPHNWVGHHKDHNPKNNSQDNLELLCKRCHQLEHKCWSTLILKA